MNRNLKIIDYVIGYEKGGWNRLDLISNIYVKNKMTKRQRAACELFLFEPNRKNALRAIEITPKAWLFIKKFKSIHQDVVITMDWILESTRKKSYKKELLKYHSNMLDLLDLLHLHSKNKELVKEIKIIKMERKLINSIKQE